MADVVQTHRVEDETAVARSLLNLGAALYECKDIRWALDAILQQARLFAHAEAGSLYLTDGHSLKFVTVQNDKMDLEKIAAHLMGKTMSINSSSLAGYVALMGQPVNIPDTTQLPDDAPFRVNRDLDASTGYRVRSILAIPLNCPHEGCIGVMELFNRLDQDGQPASFDETISDGVMSLASQAAMALHGIRLQNQLRKVHLHSIFRLSSIAEYRDADTADHIQRVSRVSELLAGALRLHQEQVELIKYASPMHDVGKVAIPDAILLKPGHLTTEQRKLMERHTTIGADIFGEPEDDVLAMARQVALTHHERWDGQGYPHKLRGEGIPLSGRIVGLADVFDAIVSRRCYKDACPLSVALDIINKDSGSHFDPVVVKAFMGCLTEVLDSYPDLQSA